MSITRIISIADKVINALFLTILLLAIYGVLDYDGNIFILFWLMTTLVIYSNIKITKYYRKELDASSNRYFALSNDAYKILNKNFKLLAEIAELKKYIVVKPKCIKEDCNGIAVPLRSINKKKCNTCSLEWDWNLDPGQKSPVIDGLNYDTAITNKADLKQIGCSLEDNSDASKD